MERRRFENKRYDELFEETRREVAQRKGPALEVDECDRVSSDLLAAEQFTDWWRASAPTYEEVESMSLDSRLVHRRLKAWFDACLNMFPSIDTMYIAEENVEQRQQLEAEGVKFSTAAAVEATDGGKGPDRGVSLDAAAVEASDKALPVVSAPAEEAPADGAQPSAEAPAEEAKAEETEAEAVMGAKLDCGGKGLWETMPSSS